MIGSEIHNLAKQLWSINRSITGDGVRTTLGQIKQHLPEAAVRLITGADHFFSGSQGELGKALEDSVDGA